MNETKWLTGTEGDAMLQYVADRLSARQRVLLSAALVRQLWPLLPEGVLRQAVDHAEQAEHPLPEAARAEWLNKIDAVIPAAVEAAQSLQREIVRSCDPDAADIDRPVLTRPNQSAPAFPLFQAASRHARNAIEGIGDALTQAADAVRLLYSEPGGQMLDLVQNRVLETSELRRSANQAASNALRLKQEGDDLADRAASSRNKRLEEARAHEIVRRIQEGTRRTDEEVTDAEDRRDRAAGKVLAQILREVVGNPFTPPRFEAAWRTSTVVQLAQQIFTERAFETLPILADALLDADCDEEAILRHCRGTELHAREPVVHQRGCWVLALVLRQG
jgi:transposase